MTLSAIQADITTLAVDAIGNAEMPRFRVVPASFHGEWNSTIHPTGK